MSVGKLLGVSKLHSSTSSDVDTSTLDGKTVLLYFSAHWCPPCRTFTPLLSSCYTKYHTSKNFEVVFCSWDQTDAEFSEYFKCQPWLAVNRGQVDRLAKHFKVQSIPTLIVLDGDTGEVHTTDGRQAVVKHPDFADFPWKGMAFSQGIPGGFFNMKNCAIVLMVGYVFYLKFLK